LAAPKIVSQHTETTKNRSALSVLLKNLLLPDACRYRRAMKSTIPLESRAPIWLYLAKPRSVNMTDVAGVPGVAGRTNLTAWPHITRQTLGFIATLFTVSLQRY